MPTSDGAAFAAGAASARRRFQHTASGHSAARTAESTAVDEPAAVTPPPRRIGDDDDGIHAGAATDTAAAAEDETPLREPKTEVALKKSRAGAVATTTTTEKRSDDTEPPEKREAPTPPNKRRSQTKTHPETVELYLGPTNSGKTYRSLQFLAEQGSGCYAGPLRALAWEVRLEVMARCAALDRWRGAPPGVGLVTGEERIDPDAPIVCCTAEAAPRSGDTLVLDEVHWCVEASRGAAWTRLLLAARNGAFRHVRICGPKEASVLLRTIFERSLDRDRLRVVPCRRRSRLTFKGDLAAFAASRRAAAAAETMKKKAQSSSSSLSDAADDEARADQAVESETFSTADATQRRKQHPSHKQKAAAFSQSSNNNVLGEFLRHACGEEKRRVAIVAFSRNAVLSLAGAAQAAGFKASALFGKLPPAARRSQLEPARRGEVDVVVTTDVIGHGVNLPIDDVVFAETRKRDETKTTRSLQVWEAAQIAGRAGRGEKPGSAWVLQPGDKDLVRRAVDVANGDLFLSDEEEDDDEEDDENKTTLSSSQKPKQKAIGRRQAEEGALVVDHCVLAPEAADLRALCPRGELSVPLLANAVRLWARRLEEERDVEDDDNVMASSQLDNDDDNANEAAITTGYEEDDSSSSTVRLPFRVPWIKGCDLSELTERLEALAFDRDLVPEDVTRALAADDYLALARLPIRRHHFAEVAKAAALGLSVRTPTSLDDFEGEQLEDEIQRLGDVLLAARRFPALLSAKSEDAELGNDGDEKEVSSEKEASLKRSPPGDDDDDADDDSALRSVEATYRDGSRRIGDHVQRCIDLAFLCKQCGQPKHVDNKPSDVLCRTCYTAQQRRVGDKKHHHHHHHNRSGQTQVQQQQQPLMNQQQQQQPQGVSASGVATASPPHHHHHLGHSGPPPSAAQQQLPGGPASQAVPRGPQHGVVRSSGGSHGVHVSPAHPQHHQPPGGGAHHPQSAVHYVPAQSYYPIAPYHHHHHHLDAYAGAAYAPHDEPAVSRGGPVVPPPRGGSVPKHASGGGGQPPGSSNQAGGNGKHLAANAGQPPRFSSPYSPRGFHHHYAPPPPPHHHHHQMVYHPASPGGLPPGAASPGAGATYAHNGVRGNTNRGRGSRGRGGSKLHASQTGGAAVGPRGRSS